MADGAKFNMRNPAVKRIMQEIKEIRQDTSGDILAEALENDIFEWHFIIRGPRDTEFEGGIYHGRILLPADYPFKPPAFMMLTPSGRFETGVKICLSISSHHPEHWQPSWSDFPKEERVVMAAKSRMEIPRFGSAERQKIIDEMHNKMLAMEAPQQQPAAAQASDDGAVAAVVAATPTSAPATPSSAAASAPAAASSPAPEAPGSAGAGSSSSAHACCGCSSSHAAHAAERAGGAKAASSAAGQAPEVSAVADAGTPTASSALRPAASAAAAAVAPAAPYYPRQQQQVAAGAGTTDHMLTMLAWALYIGIGAIVLRKVAGAMGYDLSELLAELLNN